MTPPTRKGLRRTVLAAVVAVATICILVAWRDTTADPVVRRAEVVLPGMEPGAAPLTVALISDIHVAGPDMPPSRLARIVAQVNALRPDLVLLAGDYISDRRLATRHYTYREALAPLAGLQPRLGTLAVLGNHEHWRSAPGARRAFARLNVPVLDNRAVRVGGVWIGGLDSDSTEDSDIPAMLRTLPEDHSTTLVLSHGPDAIPKLPDDITLVLAAHTHCGQVRWPWGGSPAYMSNFGDRFACGRIVEGSRTIFVTAGLGTSVLPFRFLVKPDVWLVTVRPPQKQTGPEPAPGPRRK